MTDTKYDMLRALVKRVAEQADRIDTLERFVVDVARLAANGSGAYARQIIEQAGYARELIHEEADDD